MRNKKGFTLIELMAVIILLGLIIMIIVPKITDSIENSKKNAAIDSALGYVKSARDYYNVHVLEKDYVIKEGINWIQDINSVIEVDGELPSSGYFYLENGKITFGELTFTPAGGFDPNRLPETQRLFGDMVDLNYKA